MKAVDEQILVPITYISRRKSWSASTYQAICWNDFFNRARRLDAQVSGLRLDRDRVLA